MICIIALIIFGILGIFSARYRTLAKQAFDCVFKRVTLRPCQSGLDRRLKMDIVKKVMKRSTKLASFVYKNFEALSWIFTILLLASLFYSGYSGYNYIRYGNCNGKPSESFCIFDPTGKNKVSSFESNYSGPKVYPGIDDDPYLGNKSAKIVMIEFGCFRCLYTKKAETTVKQILQDYEGKILYVYRDFPLEAKHVGADLHAEAADCAKDQGKYWEYHNLLFEKQETMINHSYGGLEELAKELKLDTKKFNSCLESRKYKNEVLKDFEDGLKAGILGTPTFFINNNTIVGPKDYSTFKKIIEEELKK